MSKTPDITTEASKILDMQSLQQALNRSQAIIEFSPDGTILTANENFLSTLGYEMDEVVGQHHRMFVDADHAKTPEYNAFWRKLGRGEFDGGEYRRVGKGGREVWISATYNPFMDASGKVLKVVKFATDITAQKMARAEMEGKVTAISKSQAVIEFSPDGNILTANENFLKTVGYTLAEIQGSSPPHVCRAKSGRVK